MNIRNLLNDRVKSAMNDAGIPADYSPHLAVSKKAGFGDYQANGAMGAAKALKTNPREVAQKIIDNLDLNGIASKVEIAGPGFINIHLDPKWLAQQTVAVTNSTNLGILPKNNPETVVIDYSSPNLAKEMHVGHLRSTIIGDAIARVLEFTGDKVIRQNHVGDWGTQFGMLIAELEDQLGSGERPELALQDLEGFYQQAKKHFDDDPAFADRARDYVVKLQSGDAQVNKLWQEFRRVSLLHAEEIYRKLNVTLGEADVRGESAYNDDLAPVVAELEAQGLAVEDQGAKVVFLHELADKNGDPSVAIIQKKDGGYLYSTSDLAALRYRVGTLKANRILYFIDARQSLHMQQVFTLARKAGFADEWLSTEHHAFGTMLGSDGKPFKTRSGGTVKLAQLLDEAVERAAKEVRTKNPDLTEEEMAEVASKVGIGAVKYADLCKTRTNDYVFNWESMLAFEGNTGPYMQYAYTRIRSIFRRANENMDTFESEVNLTEPQEVQLAIKLLQFPEIVEQIAADAYPHVMCNYLYDLASLFMTFYEACPILKEGVEPAVKNSRLQLSKGVARTLAQGLDLLGIEVMEKM
ncbi:arginine--tRNA ligase [Saccharophagus degradans]|uniref:arginine--tRNA ligase n=1 Tax=Saccharophagus degradans TaxID=86304 RepID=UPI001C0A445F|nr:arginine--tRNA ligase [Saccharophagus degradans]MBU2986484.1 arginine--tRNA ligase [Saccharophagus degradans]